METMTRTAVIGPSAAISPRATRRPSNATAQRKRVFKQNTIPGWNDDLRATGLSAIPTTRAITMAGIGATPARRGAASTAVTATNDDNSKPGGTRRRSAKLRAVQVSETVNGESSRRARMPGESGDSGRPRRSRAGSTVRSPSGSAPRTQCPVASRWLGHAPAPLRTERQRASIDRSDGARSQIHQGHEDHLDSSGEDVVKKCRSLVNASRSRIVRRRHVWLCDQQDL